ncbi:MAG: 23S rRNA (adenine(2503)-C(2))-methyltransferase RlmN [Coriobacteriia bacterium]|nr:23S rRNA (adenine(2503)-C(2))-methyltransferase RlmN [Coriobacteriia bacterium]MCL2537136.1 23S rRNA (adenine(2503)-C(2))-methyltransferase RlmN [Coriobacteriia bacterium]
MNIFDYALKNSSTDSSTNDNTSPGTQVPAASALPTYGDLMSQLGQPSFRAKQLAAWLWGECVHSYDEMTNLPADLRARLTELAPLVRGSIIARQQSKDGTRKYLIEFADGVSVEAVGLPATDASKRLTVCISSQAGCAMGCSFCATGQGGLVRNLTPGELAEQVRIVAYDFELRASNVVVMGQGEPFRNYANTLAGLRIINAAPADGGLGIGARHITLSTAGIIKGIERLSHEPEQFTLAVSLHSAVQETRDRLMPGLASQPLDKLAVALADYFDRTQRRPSLEFAVIDGISATSSEIFALIDFAQKTQAHVNLIPLNSVEELESNKGLKPASQLDTMHLANTLRSAGIKATVRRRRGADIAAACGQLAQKPS